mmetsp:Transcript_13251/g.27478  ORF Transcript_13251/g.27478 Transcript_13251/m.27478 type:complete len:358 (-) Transcript_13251:61-1134(-)
MLVPATRRSVVVTMRRAMTWRTVRGSVGWTTRSARARTTARATGSDAFFLLDLFLGLALVLMSPFGETPVPTFLHGLIAVIHSFFKRNFSTLVVILAGTAKIIIRQVRRMESLSNNRGGQATITSVASMNKETLFGNRFRYSGRSRHRRIHDRSRFHGSRSHRRRRNWFGCLGAASLLHVLLQSRVGSREYSSDTFHNLMHRNAGKGTIRGLGGFGIRSRWGQFHTGKHAQGRWEQGQGATQIIIRENEAKIILRVAVGEENLGIIQIGMGNSAGGLMKIQSAFAKGFHRLRSNLTSELDTDKRTILFGVGSFQGHLDRRLGGRHWRRHRGRVRHKGIAHGSCVDFLVFRKRQVQHK